MWTFVLFVLGDVKDEPATDYDEIDDEEEAASKAANTLTTTITQSMSNDYGISQTCASEYELPIVSYLDFWLIYISISICQNPSLPLVKRKLIFH